MESQFVALFFGLMKRRFGLKMNLKQELHSIYYICNKSHHLV
jgi:hypothetical protein